MFASNVMLVYDWTVGSLFQLLGRVVFYPVLLSLVVQAIFWDLGVPGNYFLLFPFSSIMSFARLSPTAVLCG